MILAEKVIKKFDVRTPGSQNTAGSLSGGNLQKFVCKNVNLGKMGQAIVAFFISSHMRHAEHVEFSGPHVQHVQTGNRLL